MLKTSNRLSAICLRLKFANLTLIASIIGVIDLIYSSPHLIKIYDSFTDDQAFEENSKLWHEIQSCFAKCMPLYGRAGEDKQKQER